MSQFFPWGFKAGSECEWEIPDTGCPLEDHPSWNLEAGTSPSGLCWASSDGRSVSVDSEDDVVRNISYKGSYFADGRVSAKIAMVSTATDDWILPLCARMINTNNLLGARWNNSKFEVVQRRVGTWTTVWSGGPTPALDDLVELYLIGGNWRLVVNGTIIHEGTTNIATSSGWWGVSTHRAAAFVGHTLFTEFDTLNAETAQITNDGIPVTFDGENIYHL